MHTQSNTTNIIFTWVHNTNTHKKKCMLCFEHKSATAVAVAGCQTPLCETSRRKMMLLWVSPHEANWKLLTTSAGSSCKTARSRHYNDNTCTYRSERNLGSSSSKRRNCFFIQYAFAIRLDKERKTRANVEFGFAFICIYLNEFNNIFFKFLVSWMTFVIQYCVQDRLPEKMR
jgi:hypothetical protein